MEIANVRRQVWQCGGVARRSELDVDHRALTRALDGGAVVRVARGTYALSEQQPPLVAAAQAGGVASHASAAQLWLLDLVSAPSHPHVTVRGMSMRPDLVDPVLRVVAEADSLEWHGHRRALATDCRHYDELVADGWSVLRFAWEQVMVDQEWVAQALTDTAVLCRARTGGRSGVQESSRRARASRG